MIIAKAQDIDPVEFIEGCLGIQLLPYQKELLRRMWVTDKMYIHMGQHLDTVEIRPMYEMTKGLIKLENNDV